MKLYALENAARFGGRKRFVERRRCVRVQIILHQTNILGVFALVYGVIQIVRAIQLRSLLSV